MRLSVTLLAAFALLAAGCTGSLDGDENDVGPTEEPDSSDRDNSSDEQQGQGPHAEFTYDCEALSCSFNATNSSDPDGEISSYEWDFGDENTDTGKVVEHAYEEEGTYTVALTVTNEDGESHQGDREVSVATENEQEPTWERENRTGTVSGTNAVLTEASEEETFGIEEGAIELTLNLTADGGELYACIQEPEAEEDACSHEAETEDGNTTLSLQEPAPGEWSIELSAQGTGPQSVDYELMIAQLVSPEDGR